MTGIQIETDRLLLRTARPEDLDAIVSFTRINRQFFAPFEPQSKEDYFTEAFWQERVRDYQENIANDYSYHIFVFRREGHQEVIGKINFSNIVRGAMQGCHLGYALGEKQQGHGYMHEALSSAIGHMFTERNMHRIMANYMPENIRSENVLNKLGFQREGLAKDYLRLNGKWRDHILTSLVNPNWRPL